MKHKNLTLRALFLPGVHCAEEGHQEDVCHEVHEQAEVCGEERSEKRTQRAADHEEPGAPLPRQLLVSCCCCCCSVCVCLYVCVCVGVCLHC